MSRQQEIIELRQRLLQLQNEEAEYQSLSEPMRLADVIHKATCRSNHIDMCGYEYDKWPKGGMSKDRYFKAAQEILQVIDFNKAVTVFEKINKL